MTAHARVVLDDGSSHVIPVAAPRGTTTVHCKPLEIPPRMLQRLLALEAGHWATEGIRGAVYRFGCRRNDGLSASRIVHTDTATGSIET